MVLLCAPCHRKNDDSQVGPVTIYFGALDAGNVIELAIRDAVVGLDVIWMLTGFGANAGTVIAPK